MITFTGPLWLWSGESGSWHFITVPEEEAVEIRAESLARRGGFGSVKVEASIQDPLARSGQDVSWRTSVFPMKSGGYLLPVKKEVRCKAGIAVDDLVTLTLELL